MFTPSTRYSLLLLLISGTCGTMPRYSHAAEAGKAQPIVPLSAQRRKSCVTPISGAETLSVREVALKELAVSIRASLVKVG